MTILKTTEATVSSIDARAQSLLAKLPPTWRTQADESIEDAEIHNSVLALQKDLSVVEPQVEKLRKMALETNPEKKTLNQASSDKVLVMTGKYDTVKATLLDLLKKTKAPAPVVPETPKEAPKVVQETPIVQEAPKVVQEVPKVQEAPKQPQPVAEEDDELQLIEALKFSTESSEPAANTAPKKPNTTLAEPKQSESTPPIQTPSASAPQAPAAVTAVSPVADSVEPTKSFSLFIKNVQGKNTEVKVPSLSITVSKLKEVIESTMGIAPTSQRLIFGGSRLEDEKTLVQYNVKAGDSIVILVQKGATASATTAPSQPSKPTTAPSAATSAPSTASATLTPAPQGTSKYHTGGSVINVQDGASELREILSTAGDRLIVVDWFAPWCGPCRAIHDSYVALSNKYTNVTFVQVDSEATMQNKALVREAVINAFPTFHFYRNMSRILEFKGADIHRLESSVVTHGGIAQRAPEPKKYVNPDPVPVTPERVAQALRAVKENVPFNDFIDTTKLLLAYVDNVLKNPTDLKFRRIKQSNQAFRNRIIGRVGGLEALKSFGFFEIQEDGEAFYYMDTIDPQLPKIKSMLESALGSSVGASTTPAPSAVPQTPANPFFPGAAGGFPGFPGAPGLGAFNQDPGLREALMNDPMSSEIMQEIMQDPALMTEMMQSFMDPSRPPNYASLMQNPRMMEITTRLMSNPAIMSRMMGQMQQMGGANAFPSMFGNPDFMANMQQFAQAQRPFGFNPSAAATQPGAQTATQGPQPTAQQDEDADLQEAIRMSLAEEEERKKREGGQ